MQANMCAVEETYRRPDDEASSFGVELLTQGPRLHQLVQEVAVCFFATCAAKGVQVMQEISRHRLTTLASYN